MRTELPADRVRRRLAEAQGTAPEAGQDGDPEADPGAAETSESAGTAETALSRWLPDTAGERASNWTAAIRADPGRAGVVGLAVVGVVAVLVTVFTIARTDEPRVVSANLPPVQPVSSASSHTGGPPAPELEVVVSVVGLVGTPGLVTLPPGARIADALDAAGGALAGADLTGLNMARRVADGEQVVVGLASPPGTPPVIGSSVSSPAGGGAPDLAPATTAAGAAGDPAVPESPIDLNAATVEDLDTLPGIGPVTATAIVGWRTTNGRFTSVDQLAEVDGIGPARLEKLKALVRV